MYDNSLDSSNFRNFGCRINEYIIHGMRAVTLENNLIKVSVLADKGADIYEFQYKPKDIDFMWRSFNGIRNPARYIPSSPNAIGQFLDFYEGGWQELFPIIGDPCEYKGASIGLHGEVALLSWEYQIITDAVDEICVEFKVRTIRTPYLLKKKLTIKNGDPTLYIDETIFNTSQTHMEFAWGHHPAFGPAFIDDSCQIELEDGCFAKTYHRDLGQYSILPLDKEFQWPFVEDIFGNRRDLRNVPAPDEKLFYIIYLHNPKEGKYKIKNRKKKVGFGLRWDKDIFPVLWLWAPCGGAQDYPWYGRNYNLALEPWSAVPDCFTKVLECGKGIKIGPRQEMHTSLQAYAFEL